jgi:hypothetical protein
MMRRGGFERETPQHMTSVITLLAVCAAMIACGKGGGVVADGTPSQPPGGSPPAASPPDDGAPPPPATPACAGGVAVMLRGADATGAGDRAIEVGPISVSMAGTPVAVRDGTTGLLDVTRDHAYLLGVVLVPDGVERVDVSVPVLGGRVADRAADACTGPIVFRFQRSKVDDARCHVVVQLDPWSFAELATGAEPLPVIVPAFTVRY